MYRSRAREIQVKSEEASERNKKRETKRWCGTQPVKQRKRQAKRQTKEYGLLEKGIGKDSHTRRQTRKGPSARE